MSLIIIIAIIWSASALIRSAREKRAREAAQRISYEQARIKREMREMKQRANEEVAARIALEREQLRQRREQEKLAKEQAKQAEQIAKQEERLLRIEQKLELAQRDEAHWEEEETRLYIELAGEKAVLEHCKSDPLMRGKVDACEKKVAKLTKDHYAAETKLIKARQARELCEMQKSA